VTLSHVMLDKGGRPRDGKTLQKATNLGTIEAAAKSSLRARARRGLLGGTFWQAKGNFLASSPRYWLLREGTFAGKESQGDGTPNSNSTG
jgi:hypothetical protein